MHSRALGTKWKKERTGGEKGSETSSFSWKTTIKKRVDQKPLNDLQGHLKRGETEGERRKGSIAMRGKRGGKTRGMPRKQRQKEGVVVNK